MDATVYQIILGELGDLNCSLIDALQDTFWENASLSLLSTDGKMDGFRFFSSSFLSEIDGCLGKVEMIRLFSLLQRFLLQCHNG